MIVASSWSGGKDSCLACYKAMQQGYEVSWLVNFISQQHKRVSFHGTPTNIICEQAESIGIPLLQKETTADGYEDQFKEAVGSLVEKGLEGMIFGDIYLQEHRDWIERVCNDIGIKALEPLWGIASRDIYKEFISSGFKALVVSAQSKLIGKEWLGYSIDDRFLEYLEKSKIELCGENGEYHTVVTDGPIFNNRIIILEKEIVKRNDHWFMDIQNFHIEKK